MRDLGWVAATAVLTAVVVFTPWRELWSWIQAHFSGLLVIGGIALWFVAQLASAGEDGRR